MNQKIQNNVIRDIAENWDRDQAGKRSRRVRKIAKKFKVPVSSVYRRIKELRDHGCRAVKRKSCKGISHIMPNDELKACIEIIMGFKAYDPYKPDKRISNPNKSMSTARAIEIAENMGQIPEGKLNQRTVNRWAKEYGITVKDICAPKPAVKLISKHPNHVHLVDFSVCDQYYLRDSDSKVMEREFTYKNKPNEAREKIWLFMLVDHYSNVKFMKYYLSPGESSEILIDGLMEAWRFKFRADGSIDYQFPFHGAPKILYGDKGSALMSQKVQNFLKALNVKVIEHKPGNPRAKGMVESAIGHTQKDFESELKLRSASSIEELNERVYNWTLEHNLKVKSGENRPRNSIWQEITNKQLLELPSMDILRKVTASNEIRTVDAYCEISLNNKIHGVPEDIAGHKVRVWTNIDGGISVQDMETGKMYPTVERKTAEFGTFNAYKKTAAERMQDDAIRMTHELRKSGEITPEVLRRDVSKIYQLPRTGTSVDVDSDLVQKKSNEYATAVQAKLAIAAEIRIHLGDLPDWMIEAIDKKLAETLDKEIVHKMAIFIEKFLKEKQIVL